VNKVIVVKIGGATLGNHDTAIEDIVTLQQQGKQLLVVHGGGKLITEWLQKQGVPSRFIRGERVTDQATLEVVTAVLAGLVNKDIAAAINGLDGKAAGISGVDGVIIAGSIKDPEKGYVGTVEKVNTALLETLLKGGFIPVVAPLGINLAGKAGQAPRWLNFNADFVAGEIAAAIGAEKLVFLTDVDGIRNQAGKRLPRLSPEEAEALVASGVASGGMLPKVRACLHALPHTATTCIIDGRQPHNLLKEIKEGGTGTTIGA